MTAFARSPQLRQYSPPQPGRRSFAPPQRQQISHFTRSRRRCPCPRPLRRGRGQPRPPANSVSASGAVGDVSASAKHVSVLDFGFLPLLPQLALVLAAAHALALGEVTKGKTGQTGLPRAALCELYARKNRGAMRKPAICQTHIYTR